MAHEFGEHFIKEDRDGLTDALEDVLKVTGSLEACDLHDTPEHVLLRAIRIQLVLLIGHNPFGPGQ